MGLRTRQWIILITFYTTYLMFGACVFYHIEHNAETERRAKDLQARIDINELLLSYTSPEDENIQKDILDRISNYCNKPVTNFREDKFVNPYQWTFYHCVFFAFIVCSTLGYGNITPSGTSGRYFMIGYALIGMPVNMILFAYLGEYFGSNFIKVYRKYKAYQFAKRMQQTNADEEYMPRHWSMVIKIILSLLLPALIILIFLPSLIFTYFEGWDYSISVYYSFVTLLTIGFGDFVPTFQPHQEETFGVYFIFYQIFVLLWFVFGLSYILMLIGFIARGMQSKKIRRFEQQLADNIKLTHNRIWSEVSKDVGYLRRILNEVYIMRVRPVFTEPIDNQLNYKQNRSQSCPELTLYNCKSPVPFRKRAMSVMYGNDEKSLLDQRPLQFQSRHSETNLLRIDRQKTFEQQCSLENTGELLAQVVFALNGFNADEPSGSPQITGGTDLFSDESILEDEWSIITTPAEQSNQNLINQKKQRSRAKSLFTQISKTSGSSIETPQLTWSGNNNDIQDYVNSQVKGDKKTPKNSQKDTNAGANGVVISIEKEKEADSGANRRKSVFNVINNVFKRRNTLTPSEQPKLPVKTKASPFSELMTPIRMDAPRMSIFSGDLRRRPSILSNQSASSEQVLENTTIADLIRAIESAHVKNLLGPPKTSEMVGRRRMSMVPQITRRSSVSFSSPLETPPSAGTNPIMNQRKPVLQRNRLLTLRQNSNPNRFSVIPVRDNATSAVTSPIIQRRMRRFSAIPATTVMPPRKQSISTSLHATPLALRRTRHFKQTISPLAMLSTPETPFDTPHSTRMKQSMSTQSKK